MSALGSGRGSTRGRLLISVPDMGDPNFDQGVVLMLDHGPEGALGLVLNQLLGVDMLDLLEAPMGLVAEPQEVFLGGPVAAGAIMAIGRRMPGGSEQHLVPVFDGLALVEVDELLSGTSIDVDAVRFYAGYSGWAPGQLDAELAAGVWHVVDARLEDVFCEDPASLWRTVMHRQGGRLAAQSLFPEDVSVN